MTYISSTESAPKNRRKASVVQTRGLTEWEDGFGIGWFFGGLFTCAVLLGFQWLNG